MQDNFSVTGTINLMTEDTGIAVQVMLAKLLEIYDVKTLVAHLNGVGEHHWSPAIFKRVVANETWHRLSDREYSHLKTLLPTPPVHHPQYAFRFIDLFRRHWRYSPRLRSDRWTVRVYQRVEQACGAYLQSELLLRS